MHEGSRECTQSFPPAASSTKSPPTTSSPPVIFLNDGKKIVTDATKLAKAKVTAEIVDQFKGEKQIVFKFKKRKRYRRLKGHRSSSPS